MINGFHSLDLFLFFLIFFFVSAFFSASEAAFLALSKVDRNRLARALKRTKFPLFGLPLYLHRRLDRFIATVLLGNYLANMLATLAAAQLFQMHIASGMESSLGLPRPIPDLVFIASFTLLVLLGAEFIPKRFAFRLPKTFVLIASPLVGPFYLLVSPVFSLGKGIREGIRHLFIWSERGKKNRSAARITPSSEAIQEKKDSHEVKKRELLGYIVTGAKSGALSEVEGELLRNALDFADNPISTFLIPRDDIKAIDLDHLTSRNALKKLKAFPHSFIPLYRGSIDNVEGILSKKKLAFAEEKNVKNIDKLLRMSEKPLLIPESKNAIDVLLDIGQEKISVAMITDEYGGIEGMVTLQDIATSLFGTTRSKGGKNRQIRQLSDQSYSVDAFINLNELNRYFGINITCKNAETLAGYLLELFHRIPTKGEQVGDGHFVYTVQSSSVRRIKRVMLELQKKP